MVARFRLIEVVIISYTEHTEEAQRSTEGAEVFA